MEEQRNKAEFAQKHKRGMTTRRALVSFGALILISTAAINCYQIASARPQIVTQIQSLPKREVGVVLGTDLMRADGSTNVHFRHRVEGAAIAYLGGKVDHLVISGSPNNKGYNEVLGIQSELLKKGIPQKNISLDFEGVRTIDSIRKVRDVFQRQTVTIITDDFHAPRAIFLSRHFGIDTIAFCYGKEPKDYWFLRSRVREYFARIKAVSDIAFAKIR